MAQRKAQVIDLGRFLDEEETKPRPFGAVRRRKHSTKLYVRFPYLGQIVNEATGLEGTPANERKLRAFLDRVGEGIKAGTFRFDEAFPGANSEKKELFARLEGPRRRSEVTPLRRPEVTPVDVLERDRDSGLRDRPDQRWRREARGECR